MDTAVLAVVGTLGGVVVTAASSLLGIWLTSRNQRLSAERQVRSATDERLRNERRSACIDYLAAYSDFREKVLAAHRQSRASGPATGAAAPKPVEYAPEETARFSRTHHALQITYHRNLADLAQLCTRDLWDMADHFTDDPEEFSRRWAAARESRLRLREAMRDDLASG